MSTLHSSPAPSWGRDHQLFTIGSPAAATGAAEDRLLIIETLNRYGWAYDERDYEALEAVFTEDFVFEGSVAGEVAVGPYEGRAVFMEWLTAFWETQKDQRRHNVLNPVINGLTDTTAQVLAYLFLTGAENGVMNGITTGFYRTNMVKTDGVWLIKDMYAGFDTPF